MAGKRSSPKTPPAICAASEIPPRLKLAAKKFSLTARQLQVLHFTTRGDTIEAIAAALHISTRTVEYHRQRILRKTRQPTLPAAIFSVVFLSPTP